MNIIYTRISTPSQIISLNTQFQICLNYALENKMKIHKTYSETHSAFKKTPKILNNIINKKNQTILISCVDRFSRDISIGNMLLKKALYNNNKIIFVNESFIYDDTNYSKQKVNKLLYESQLESEKISNRLKNYNMHKKKINIHTGQVPYGYKVINKKLIKNIKEIKIINFINSCRQDNTNISNIINDLKIISKNKHYKIPEFNKKLSYNEISKILNSNHIFKRNKPWNAGKIKSALISFNRI